MKILVPTDGSKYAEEALYTAIELLKAKSGELFLLTVVPSTAGFDLELSADSQEKIRAEFEAQGAKVINRACDIAHGEGVKVSCKGENTAPSIPEAIVAFAEKEQVDLIVIGTKGLGPTSRFRMGSVASKVVRHAPCSVYVVKKKA
jgi:nucleotide-binding universal stress UspA family protein